MLRGRQIPLFSHGGSQMAVIKFSVNYTDQVMCKIIRKKKMLPLQSGTEVQPRCPVVTQDPSLQAILATDDPSGKAKCS